jgi:hypothetical protein
MNKSLNEKLKEVITGCMLTVFNVSKTDDVLLGVQLIGADNYYYEITKILDKIAFQKKMNFFTIDLVLEDFGLNEIDEKGKVIMPEWLKTRKDTIIFVYNIDDVSKKNYKFKQLKELFKEQKINGTRIPSNKFFVLISNRKDIGSGATIMKMDFKNIKK